MSTTSTPARPISANGGGTDTSSASGDIELGSSPSSSLHADLSKNGSATPTTSSKLSSRHDSFHDNVDGVGNGAPPAAAGASTVNGDHKKMKQQQQQQKKSGGGGGKVLGALAMYTTCSVSMVLVNKSLASSYNQFIEGGALNILLVVFQAIVAVVAVEFCKMMGWVDYPAFSLHTARQWAPVNVLFCVMLFTSMAALQHNAVPMVTV